MGLASQSSLPGPGCIIPLPQRANAKRILQNTNVPSFEYWSVSGSATKACHDSFKPSAVNITYPQLQMRKQIQGV